MFVLDLTPDDLKESQVRRSRVHLWIAVLASLVLGILCAAGIYIVQWKKEQNILQSFQQELQSVQSRITALSQTQNQLDLWRDRIAVLAQLGLYPEYVRILDFLQKETPESIYLSKLEFIHPEKSSADSSAVAFPAPALPKSAQMFLVKNQLIPSDGQSPVNPAFRSTQMTLLGKAIEHESVATYLHTLQSSEWFTRVRLLHSRRQIVNQDSMIEFEIQCILVPREPSQENNP